MADRSDPFDGIASVLDSVVRQLEAAARSWESESGPESESSAAAKTETTTDTRQQIDLSTHASSVSSASSASSTSTATAASTNLDLVDEGDAFVVTVDVPGYEIDDLEIRLSGSTLSIRGERERERSETTDGYVRRERDVRSFSRQLALPEPVAADDVSATVNNGMLTVRLPKRDFADDATAIDIE